MIRPVSVSVSSGFPGRLIAPGLALIFDMDGVIVDSMPVHIDAWRRYLKSIGHENSDIIHRMHGRRNDEIILDLLGAAADAKEVMEHGAAKERLYREMMHDRLANQLVPGIPQFLERTQGCPVAVASNAERANIDFVLDQAGLRKYFQVIVDGSQVVAPKPAPDVYLRAAQELRVDPKNCIVFEDSPVGIAAARAAGARVAGVLTHSTELGPLDFSTPDFLAVELEQWLAAQRPA